MGCCDKARRLATTAKHIAQGYTALALGKKYEFANERIMVCQECDAKIKRLWDRGQLWCSLCGCYMPAAALVKDKKCPLDQWPATKLQKNEEISDAEK